MKVKGQKKAEPKKVNGDAESSSEEESEEDEVGTN